MILKCNRKFLILVFACLSSCGIFSQCSIIYGVVWHGGPPWSLVAVNRFNGTHTVLDTIPDVSALTTPTQTLENDSGLYVTMGYDTNFKPRIYTIDVNTGNIKYSAQMPDSNISGLNYDEVSKKIYAFMHSGNKWYFITLNQYNGSFNILSVIPGLASLTSTTEVIGSDSGVCFAVGKDTLLKQWIYTLYLSTGAVKYKYAMDSDISQFQYDSIRKTIYCVRNMYVGENYKWFFDSLNPYNGVVKDIDSIPGLKSFFDFSSTYAQDSEYYYFDGIDSISGSQQFYTLNAINGNMVRRPWFGSSNFDYDASQYGQCSALLGMNTIKSSGKEKRLCFPNPFTDYTTLLFHSGTKHKIEVSDITGRLLSTTSCNGRHYILKRNGLAPGLYFVKVYDSGGDGAISTFRVIVQ